MLRKCVIVHKIAEIELASSSVNLSFDLFNKGWYLIANQKMVKVFSATSQDQSINRSRNQITNKKIF